MTVTEMGQVIRLLVATLALIPSSLAAQASGSANAGDRVRIALPEGRTIHATLVAPIDGRSEMIAYCPWPPTGCPQSAAPAVERRRLSELTRVDVRRGGNVWRGAAIGGGLALVSVVALTLAWDDSDSSSPVTTEWLVGTAGVTALGASIGAMVSSSSGHWEQLR